MMMPGQTPYSPEELKRLHALLSAAADEDPGEAGEEAYLREHALRCGRAGQEAPTQPDPGNSTVGPVGKPAD